MRNVMFKSANREIRQSLGRWFAILAIVALGVGFFSGLKVCKEAFLETGNQYLSEHSFFDYELISTLGLEEEDVNTIKETEGVEAAEGSYSADVLISFKDDDSGEVCSKFLTISENINTPNLVAGKMPKNDNECLGDARFFTEDDIGSEILISSSNKEDTLDMLSYDSYILTGIADSPLYLNFERGSSSIGDGSMSCFVLIPSGGFSSDVYTEVYVKLQQSAFIFSDEYDSISDNAEEPLEEALETCSQRRYDSIIEEAYDKVSDAEVLLSDKKAELANAQSEIASNEQSLNDAQKLLDDGRREYEAGVEKYHSEKTSAYEQLELYHSSGAMTEEQYLLQKSSLDQQFENAWSVLEASESELEAKQSEIDSGLARISDAKAELAEGQEKINEAEKELSDAKKEVNSIEYPDNYVLGRDTNTGYVCFDNDTSIVEGIAEVFPLFFFLVAALVCMTTMSRMIEEHRTQIGVLKALGYSRNQILGKYIFYSASSAFIGGVGGFFVGTYLFTWVIWEAYRMMYDFADVIIVFDWTLGGLALLAALICSVGTTLYACYHELSQVPAELIRPKAPASGKRIFFERISFVWNRLKFLQKVSIRNVFRYKKRFFMMILGICGCTALVVTGFGIQDSIKNVVSMQYDEIYHIDYEVTFNHAVNDEEKSEFLEENKDYVDECLFIHSSSVDARINEQIKSVNLIVCDDDNPIDDFIDLHNDSGKLSYPSEGEGIINDNLATTLGISVGDELTVYDSELNPLTVKIIGFCDNYVYNYLYINDATYRSAWGEPEINTAFVLSFHGEDGKAINPHETGAALMEANNVSSVSVTEDFRNRINNMMKSLDYVIALVIICAGALAFIVLYNLTNINITERIREIATIKVLGFYPRETSQYVFRENIALTAISALVGLPLGTGLHRFVMDKIKIDLLSFDVHIAPLSYVLAVLLTFVFAMIVNWVMRFKLDKISMTESLKSIE